MKAVFKYGGGLALALALGCDGGDDDATGIAQEDASRIAQDAVGGEPGEVERSTEGDHDVWEVYVAMANGATLEVKIEIEEGQVLVVEDKTGPFDYPNFTPVAGVLSYDDIKGRALEEVDGEIEAWEFKQEHEHGDEAGELEYEFYVRDAEAQLWEIKFDATDGTATEIEAKDMVDE